MNENITKKYNKDAAKEQNHTDTVNKQNSEHSRYTVRYTTVVKKKYRNIESFLGRKKKKTQKKEIKNHTLGKKKQQPKNPYVIIIWDQE